MIVTSPWKLLGRCIAWGFAIEAPILAWFLSVQDRMHVSMIPGILFVFHFASYALSVFLLRPLNGRISTVASNWLGISLMGCFQAILIGGLVFLAKLAKQRASMSEV